MADIEDVPVQIPFGEKRLSAKISPPHGSPKLTVILTHGAGGSMDLEHLVTLSHDLARAGYKVVRFTCLGGGVPYRGRAYRAVIEWLHSLHTSEVDGNGGFVLSGRSMGARAAVEAANAISNDPDAPAKLKASIKGVICLAYPLHPPKEPQKLRDEPLKQLNNKCLFLSGTKDSMCTQTLMLSCVQDMKNATVRWLKNADHGFNIGSKKDAAVAEVSCVMLEWLKTLGTESPENSDSMKNPSGESHLNTLTKDLHVDLSQTNSDNIQSRVNSKRQVETKKSKSRKRKKSTVK